MAVLAETEMGERRAVQVQRIALDQVGRRHALVIMVGEGLRESGEDVIELVVQTVGHALEQIGLLVLQSGCHGSLAIGARPAVYHRSASAHSAGGSATDGSTGQRGSGPLVPTAIVLCGLAILTVVLTGS